MSMNQIVIPAAAEEIITKLEQLGYEGYAVGGCVRDSLLRRIPKDWDITTNATPEQVTACFAGYRVLPTGIAHGTVTVLFDHLPVEITTYRVDGSYEDHRHPDQVEFSSHLHEDLARRDFTINAMAYHPQKGLQDYFDGLADLKARYIRCVGNPRDRFGEDALRILRCARFASELAFSIDPDTVKAMLELVDTLDYVAWERIQVELNKSLLGDGFADVFLEFPQLLEKIIPEISASIGFEQHSVYHCYDVYTHMLTAVKNAAPDLVVRLTLLLHDIGKPNTFTLDSEGNGHFPRHGQISCTDAKKVLKRLKYSNEIMEEILLLVGYHDAQISATTQNVRRWLGRIGEVTFRKLLLVQWADASAKEPHHGKTQQEKICAIQIVLEQTLEQQLCFSLAQLAVSGKDLLEHGYVPGPKMGQILHLLLEEVIAERIPNERQALLTFLEKHPE